MSIVDIEIIYCGGVDHRCFKNLEEAFIKVEKAFGPIYYDEKNDLYAIVDGIELYIYPTVIYDNKEEEEEASDVEECVKKIVWDPSKPLFMDKETRPNFADIDAKYYEAVKRAFKASVDWHEGTANGNTEAVKKAAAKMAKYTNYAVALGWVLGIPREHTEYNCDCEA